MENLFIKYRLNHNQKIEATEIISELLLQGYDLATFEQFASNDKQIADSFMVWLRGIRYPEFSRYHKQLSSLLKHIHNNNSVFRVVYNDNFESDEYNIIYLEESHTNQKAKLDEKKEYLDKLTALIKTGSIL